MCPGVYIRSNDSVVRETHLGCNSIGNVQGCSVCISFSCRHRHYLSGSLSWMVIMLVFCFTFQRACSRQQSLHLISSAINKEQILCISTLTLVNSRNVGIQWQQVCLLKTLEMSFLEDNDGCLRMSEKIKDSSIFLV